MGDFAIPEIQSLLISIFGHGLERVHNLRLPPLKRRTGASDVVGQL